MLKLNDGRSELWQWDTGRKLTVDAECSQVHFSNKVFGRSIDMPVIDGVVEVPDFLLQTDKDLNAWAFVGTAENGYTKISKVFKVNKRNKPADYVFTPPEQTTLAGLVDRLNKIEENQDPDAIKNAVEDYLEQNPVEAPVQSVNGKTGEIQLTADDVGAISQEDLQEATNNALAQAKVSGLFDGADGKDGADGQPGADGKDYVLTEADRQEIAQEAAGMVEVPDVNIPTTLPNPNALTFTGAATGTYDGSAPLTVNIPEGGGGSGGGYGDYEVLIDEIITTDGAGISAIRYTELDFSNYNDIVIVFDRASNKANSGQDIKVSIRMLGHILIYNQSIANPVDSYRSCFYRVLNMGNGNVVSFASTANNQNNNPSQLYCCGIFPLNGAYQAGHDNGFSLDLSQAYIGTINIKILAK